MCPLLKRGKHPQEIRSYPPISLTSCVGKVMEIMVRQHLSWLLESTGVVTYAMAEFRQHRRTADRFADIASSLEQAAVTCHLAYLYF